MRCARLTLGTLLLSVDVSAQADLVPAPGQVDFGYRAVGTTSESKATTLRNTGGQAAGIVSITPATGVHARTGGTCGAPPFTLAAQSICTLKHTFTPTGVAQFPQTHTITLAGGSSVAFGLYGQGEVGYLEIFPTSLWFSSVAAGSTSGTLTATMNNIRPVPRVVVQMNTTSVPPDSFVRAGGTCPEPSLEVGGHGGCVVEFAFAPQAVGPASGKPEYHGVLGHLCAVAWR